MSSAPLILLDEWETVDRAVEAQFRVMLTGGTDKRRELYTTSNQIELPCKAAVILTSNASPIRTAATSRRFITIPVAARQGSTGEAAYQSIGASVLPGFLAQRGALWAELIGDLHGILRRLPKTDPHTKTSFSMSDFGVLTQRCADAEGWGNECREMFWTLERAQEDHVVEHSFYMQLIADHLARQPSDVDVFYTAAEWCNKLVSLIPERDREGLQKLTKNCFGQTMKLQASTYRNRLGMRTASDDLGPTKVNRYSFRGYVLPEEKP